MNFGVARRVAILLLGLPRRAVVLCLRLYRLVISPLYGPTCRFYPSCSEYALIAVDRHGVIRGGWLAVRRLLRCHPWNPGGVDPVPPLKGAATTEASSTVVSDPNSAPSSIRRAA
jgi:putative membrane protein insertion efficiency factor